MSPPIFHRYLQAHAEPEVQHLSGLAIPPHSHVLTLPAYQEDYRFLEGLPGQNALTILVINQPDLLPNPCQINRQLLRDIEHKHTLINTIKNLSLFKFSGKENHLLVVDRFTSGSAIPHKQGVGLARKIAADLSVALIATGIIEKPWIYSSDCDTQLPGDYFIDMPPKAAAMTYPFRHNCDADPVGIATKLYEESLHYYQRGLQSAGSPYAYHSLGSALAFRAENYCQVRGFPKRAGGEDFYLLNKLAKTGEIVALAQPEIIIAARNSSRVPFGTGPAVAKIMALENPQQEFTVYHPACFTCLKQLLDAVKQKAQQPDEPLAQLDSKIDRAVASLKLSQALEHARQHSDNPQQFLRHFHTWFDAFRTLKFIHLLRDGGLVNVPSAAVLSTLVPSTLVPSTMVPSTMVPSTMVPSTTVPSTTVPSTMVPPTTAKADANPQSRLPDRS